MRHKGDRTQTLGERTLPAVAKTASRFSTLGGTRPKDKPLSARQMDAIWAGAGVKKRKKIH
jgi:hypothetical protein